MGREFELKYAADDRQIEALKNRYPHLAPIAMQTTYYDSPDGQFGKLHWTFRRRLENGKSVCTLKTPAGALGRNEWEVECGDILEAVDKLCEIGAPLGLAALTVNGVVESCAARFTRLAGILEIPGATVELALDHGVLTGGGRELPLMEVEVELKEGSEDAAAAFASELARELGLKQELRSKVARARRLAAGE